VPEENSQQVLRSLNDYAMISMREGNKTRKIRVADTNNWHKDELAWLEKEVRIIFDHEYTWSSDQTFRLVF